MKKLAIVILSLVMLLSLSVNAFAYETEQPAYSVTINEYDVYVATRTASSDELMRRGVPKGTADIIKSSAIEEELTKLSSLSDEELNNLGYTENQIEVLQNYSGERIESNIELRGIFADMTCDFYNVSASTSALSVKVIWEWSNVPLLAGAAIEDMVAIRWQGTNNSGQPINLALNSSGSSCTVQYYSRGSSPAYKSSKYPSVSTDDPYGHAYSKIAMSAGTGDANGDYYAKKGTLITKVERTGTNLINEAAFVFAYGHTTIVISPSLSLPASFGIGFSWGTEKMCEEAIRMNSSGTITKY